MTQQTITDEEIEIPENINASGCRILIKEISSKKDAEIKDLEQRNLGNIKGYNKQIQELQSKLEEKERLINCVKNHPRIKPLNCCYQADRLELEEFKENRMKSEFNEKYYTKPPYKTFNKEDIEQTLSKKKKEILDKIDKISKLTFTGNYVYKKELKQIIEKHL